MAVEIAALSIIDRLINLLTVRERNKTKYFNNFIEPLYKDAEPVASDYMVLFAELIQRIEKAKTFEELITWIELRRATYQPVRMKIRALLQDPSLGKLSGRKHPTARIRFAKGLWGVLKGSLLLGQGNCEGHSAYYVQEYGFHSHPVLVLLEGMRELNQTTFTSHRTEVLVSQARSQQNAIEAAWADVVAAYAELKRDLL